MKKNISTLKNCYGCGVCVKSCPTKIITLSENNNGFYKPVIINESKCIECGVCLDICAFNHASIATKPINIKSFAAWSTDDKTRSWCSSGGIGFEIGRYLISQGYKAIGVRYNVITNRAEHYIANTVEDFMPSVGSKYIPSFTTDALHDIKRNEKYLFIGTPCQIDSMRRYIRRMKIEENFVLLDFFCHGVPSLLLWDEYISEVADKIGPISFVSWRNKRTGWHDSWSMNADNITEEPISCIDWHDSYNLKIKEKKHIYTSRKSTGDLFYKFFLSNYCLNDCCYTSCKYKMLNSSADIRIGDLWGTKYAHDEKGVSSVIAFSELGKKIIGKLAGKSCEVVPESIETTTEGQLCHNVRKPITRNLIIAALKNKLRLSTINNTLILSNRILNQILRKLHLPLR